MKSEMWQRVETLFHQALEINDDEREAYLKTATQGDFELLSEVEHLLKSYRAPDSFMEESVFSEGLQALATDEADAPPGKLGRYEIIK